MRAPPYWTRWLILGVLVASGVITIQWGPFWLGCVIFAESLLILFLEWQNNRYMKRYGLDRPWGRSEDS